MPTRPYANLARLQRWMQAVVVHPGSVEDGLGCSNAQREIPRENLGDVILPSAHLTSEERIRIYHGMYLQRMDEVLASDYVALRQFLGHKAFRDLVRDYVEAHPSRSFTLNTLGDHLPGFVRDGARLTRREFCYELALLELAVTHVFDAEEAPPIEASDIEMVLPDAWPRAVLRPIPAFRLLSFRYPVNVYLQAVRDDRDDYPPSRRKDSWVAVYRRNYSVYRLDLSHVAHDLLANLVAAMPLGQAMEVACRRGGRHCPNESEIFSWFRDWATGGIFRSIEY